MAAHSTRVKAALARLPEVDPAIAALALWCQYRDGDGPTMTAGEVIVVGPEFPLLPISEQTGVIAHHVLHVALRHSARRMAAQARFRAGFQPMLYDLACDAMVNEALLQAQHALPRPAVRAADVVAMLPVADRPDNVLVEWDCDQLYAVMTGRSGGTGGETGEAFQRYAIAQGFASDLTGTDADRAEPEVWAGRVTQALQAGQRAGSGIGAILIRFGDLPRAVVPWEVKLRRLLATALAQHPVQSQRRPARGWLARDAHARQTGEAQPAFAPALRWERDAVRLVVALDTSSSITDPILAMFAAEAVAIVRRTGAEAHVLGFDTEVHSRGRLTGVDDLRQCEMRRGGGTDFGPMLAEAQALTPAMTVVLTDLDAPTPAGMAMRLLWAVPTAPPMTPSCGEVLIMDDLDRP